MIKSRFFRYVAIAILMVFALLTLFLSGSLILDWFGIRAKEGNYVLFVVWANFICSWLYLLSVYGLIKGSKWTVKPLITSILVLVAALAGLFVHIQNGGLYETKTIGALFFRIGLTVVFAITAYLTTIKWRNRA
ncbi:hypothetical protein K8352_04580 [Flavobacteriaceae bacterium F89]|uniref:Uncharacterized protein n=1 Tax=Cerina litoralis TaxID=2874477 RepID=A0AAE3ES30_9FLAO|nr:hypothetical protein [Cerina litoralis]MCG2460010.1 hypothetical protein [Cerina litoralis]